MEFVSNRLEECPICFDKITNINNCTTPCGHVFCFRCIAESMNTKTLCPCCRKELVESKSNNSKDDSDNEDIDIEGSDTEDEEDDDDEYDEDDDDNEEDSPVGEIETVMERFVKRGHTLMDALLIITERSSKRNNNYNDDYVIKLLDDFDEMIDELDNETMENDLMSKEDVRIPDSPVVSVAPVK